MQIRLAQEKDRKYIAELYNIARLFMSKHGNPTQWTDQYPNNQTISEDLKTNSLYVVEQNKKIVGTFFFQIGNEIDYSTIYEGQWLNNMPYGIIHRLASNGTIKGLSKVVFDWCFTKIDNIRMDTHVNNYVMQNCLEKYGFLKVGIVHIIEDGNKPYIAYQLQKNSDS